MKRRIREFVAFETGNPMSVDLTHIYGLQRHVQQFGESQVPGTNIYFDFGIVIFVAEDYETLKEEIFGDGNFPITMAPVPNPPSSLAG